MNLPTTKPNDRDIAWYISECEDLRNRLDKLERENAELRADKERLDWLEECHGWPEYIDAEWHFGGEVFSSHRAAIDAARAKEAKP